MATDPRGLQGILSRGRNVYRGGSNAAHMGGGPQFGRPPTSMPTPLLRQIMLQKILGQAGAAPQEAPVSPALDPGASPVAQMQAAAARRVDVPQPGMERPAPRPMPTRPPSQPPGGFVPPAGHALKSIEFHAPTEMANAKVALQQAEQQQAGPQPWFADAAQKFMQMKQQAPAPMQAQPVGGPMQRVAQRRTYVG